MASSSTAVVPQTVFGATRLIDIPAVVFATTEEITSMEAPFSQSSDSPGSDQRVCMDHGWFESVAGIDGTEKSRKAMLHYRRWTPPASVPIKAVVNMMHGISTHGGKALELSGRKLNGALLNEQLAANGYMVYAHDMYGHGFSEGVRWFIPKDYETNLADYERMCQIITEEQLHRGIQVPLILLGESYGSALTILLAMRLQRDPSAYHFDSFILTCPALKGDLPPLPVLYLLRYVLAPMYPTWRPFFMPNPVSTDRIWQDPQVLAYRSQPRMKEMMLDGSGIPFRLGTAVQLLTALEAAAGSASQITMPYCILHGTKDYACPIEGADNFWEQSTQVPKADREYHKIENGYHDFLAGPQAEQCVQLILGFIAQRVGKYQPK